MYLFICHIYVINLFITLAHNDITNNRLVKCNYLAVYSRSLDATLCVCIDMHMWVCFVWACMLPRRLLTCLFGASQAAIWWQLSVAPEHFRWTFSGVVHNLARDWLKTNKHFTWHIQLYYVRLVNSVSNYCSHLLIFLQLLQCTLHVCHKWKNITQKSFKSNITCNKKHIIYFLPRVETKIGNRNFLVAEWIREFVFSVSNKSAEN